MLYALTVSPKAAINKKSSNVPGKVYFIAWYYDVKLQADNHVRWDVAERLNRKQK
jgi:hypothetical protein